MRPVICEESRETDREVEKDGDRDRDGGRGRNLEMCTQKYANLIRKTKKKFFSRLSGSDPKHEEDTRWYRSI